MRLMKTKKRLFKILFISFISVIILTGILLFLALSDINGVFRGSGEVSVTVSKGSTTSGISGELKKAGVINYPFLFKMYSKRVNADGTYKYGTFTLNKNMKYDEIISVFQGIGQKKDVVRFTITEGQEIKQIIEMLSENNICNKEKLIDVLSNYPFEYSFLNITRTGVNRLEGYLFPDTYEVFVNESEESIIKRILGNFDIKTKELRDLTQENGKKFDDIIIMASIVEREGKKREELPLVASVFYNRLKDRWKLESCATVQYVMPERRDILTYEDLETESLYNTYKYIGLPPGPISNPGLEAINAAVNPTQSKYYFFVAKSDGSHLFAKTLAEHNNNIRIASS